MSSFREAFENPDVAQGNFYSAQQILYQQVEPNRFLPKNLDPNFVNSIGSNFLTNFDKYDPYTETTTNTFTLDGVTQLLKGQKESTDEETYCRGLTGASGLQSYRNEIEQTDEIKSPIRCGWRYKKSPGGGVPLVSQGALGTINGPLNPKADPLEEGVQWIWDLRKASNQHVKDFVATLPASSSGLATAQTAMGGAFSNTAYCAQTGRYILVDSAGNPLPGYQCGRNSIITNPSQFPQTTTNPTTSLLNTNASLLERCSRPGNNPALTRECLLQAVTNSGCSTDGTLYQALQSGRASDTRYDRFLTNQNAFTTYQSKQGDNKITEDLFAREKGSWDMATQAIQKLHTASQNASDPVLRVAAQDLCLRAGTFDSYDFCADLSDSAAINGVDLKCIQNFWQEKNGKPAGLAYPKTKAFSTALGKINTWGEYKSAVSQLKEKTNSSDPLVQRSAINNFFGVNTRTEPFSPLNLEDVDMQFRLGGQPLAFWMDAKDASSFTIDTLNRVKEWRDKSPIRGQVTLAATQLLQDNRPVYKRDAFPGLEFDGASKFMSLPESLQNSLTGNFILFVVEKRKSGKDPNFFIAGAATNTNTNLVLGYRNSTVATMAFFNNDLDIQVPAYSQSLEPVRIWAFEKTSTGRNIYINGALIRSDTRPNNLMSWRGPTLGKYGNSYYQGSLHEILLYTPGVGSEQKRRKVEGYLAWKWGVVDGLPNTHPYKLSPP